MGLYDLLIHWLNILEERRRKKRRREEPCTLIWLQNSDNQVRKTYLHHQLPITSHITSSTTNTYVPLRSNLFHHSSENGNLRNLWPVKNADNATAQVCYTYSRWRSSYKHVTMLQGVGVARARHVFKHVSRTNCHVSEVEIEHKSCAYCVLQKVD